MKKIEMEYPKVISSELDKHGKSHVDGIKTQQAQIILDGAAKGVVGKDGKWLIDPGFTLEKLGVGVCKVTHMWGYENTSLSVTLLESPGSFTIDEHHPNYFVVKTTLNQKPIDKEFAFTLIKVISSPVQIVH